MLKCLQLWLKTAHSISKHPLIVLKMALAYWLIIPDTVVGRGQRLKSRLTWQSPPSRTPRVVPLGWHAFHLREWPAGPWLLRSNGTVRATTCPEGARMVAVALFIVSGGP